MDFDTSAYILNHITFDLNNVWLIKHWVWGIDPGLWSSVIASWSWIRIQDVVFLRRVLFPTLLVVQKQWILIYVQIINFFVVLFEFKSENTTFEEKANYKLCNQF